MILSIANENIQKERKNDILFLTCHLRDKRHQIVGYITGIFSHRLGRMSPRRVKVSQNGHAPIFGILFSLLAKQGMTRMKIPKYLLLHVLRPAVAVGNRRANFIRLFQLRLLIFGNAVDGRGTREYDGSTTKLFHQIE